MLKKIFTTSFKVLTLCFVTLAILACIGFGVLQTDWCKGEIRKLITEKAKEEGLSVTLGTIQGMPPLKWSIDQVTIERPEGSSLTMEHVKLRIALFPLLRKHLTISYLSIDKAHYRFSKPSFTSLSSEHTLALPKVHSIPFSFASRHIRIRTLDITNTVADETLSVSVLARAKIKKDLKDLLLFLQISQANSPLMYTKIFIDGSEKKGALEARIDLHIPSTKLIQPIVSLPFDGSLELKSSLKGSWQSWKELALQEKKNAPPLHVAFTGMASHLAVPCYPFLDSSWKVKGALLLYPDLAIDCKKLSASSSFLEFVSKFSLDERHKLTRLTSVFTLSDLSRLATNTPVPVRGDLKGKIKYSPSSARAALSSKNLAMGEVKYDDAQLHLHLQNEDQIWKGCLTGHLFSDLIDIRMSSELAKQEEKVFFSNVELLAKEARLDGDLSYNLKEKDLEGALFVQALSLRPFRALFPKDSDLDGTLGGEIHFASTLEANKTNPLPEIKAHLLIKNLRYFDKLISSAQIDLKAHNLLEKPEGSLSIHCENILYKDIFLSKFDLQTEECDPKHPFTLHAEGTWKDELQITSSGFWHKEADAWRIDVNTFSGMLLRKPFSLEKPFSVYGAKDLFALDSFYLTVAEGSFFLDGKIESTSARLTTKAEHLPLDVLTLTQPGLLLYGATSFDGMLEASPKKKAGYLNIALEQADVLQQGKTEPFKAKGTLQAHLHNEALQIFSHIYATSDQFIDFTATLPLKYSFAPFHIEINKEARVAAELTGEGELEAIFDFVNIGSHKAAGLITTHLFLSKTLSDPSLVGQIDLQKGTYENYVIGTRLKNISAKIQAADSELNLIQFTSEGKEKGTLEATGQMQLSPENKFPYTVNATLQDLHFLHFDLISTNFTGHLRMSGNTESSTVQGDVEVPEATINIAETLPTEVPELEITFVNKPIHLEGTKNAANKLYPLHYDVNITAPDRVLVKGRGLSSEWKGSIHLGGRNAAVSAEGSLSLLKGDFTFSGKKFQLTQGEITFKEKPTPSAFIKISGALQMSDVQVIALMQGPLESPSLTFQSIPHMPTSSILARILFNKDITEISALQAIQIANVIVSMSGSNGPDVLEAIRRSIGVDSLRIIEKDGTDEISVQVGWYLTHGVTISLAQSATSSDVIIEVDLKHGFIFQAETQNQEEGKFSLKWNKNY